MRVVVCVWVGGFASSELHAAVFSDLMCVLCLCRKISRIMKAAWMPFENFPLMRAFLLLCIRWIWSLQPPVPRSAVVIALPLAAAAEILSML